MRILYLSSNPNYRGGAALTDQAFTRRLTELGHQCLLTDFRDFEGLRQLQARFRPDRIVASGETIFEAVRLGQRYGIPCLAYLHSYEYCPPPKWQARAWRLGKSVRPLEESRWALQAADGLVSNSRYFQEYLLRVHGLKSRVIEPAFEPDRFLFNQRHRPKYLAGVCGLPHKGSLIFGELAQSLPELSFLLVGPVLPHFRRKLELLPNVRFRPLGDPRPWLARTRLLLAPAQWVEPFGRMAVEAMANGIPVLASRCGGLAEIVGRDGVRCFRSPGSWRAALQKALTQEPPTDLRLRAWRWLKQDSGRMLADFLQELEPKTASAVVHWQGECSTRTAHAMLNQRWASPAVHAKLPRDLTINHDYQENFSDLQAPGEGKWVAVRTWDFGRYPRSWIEKIEREFDELWVYSQWTKAQAVASGLSPGRVRVMPPGVDTHVFRPDGSAYPLPTRKSFKLLFLGASIYRKGVDILLRAYSQAFNRADDVCLIIKDREDDVFYRGQDYSGKIAALQADPTAPELIHLRDFLNDSELADLYRSCHAAVFPYRAEGFALPILEAMASGLPVVVPDQGACWDYVGRDCSYPVACRRLSLPVCGRWTFNSLGMSEELATVESLETDPADLASVLRKMVNDHQGRQRRGREARHRAELWSWEASLERVNATIKQLCDGRLPRRFRLARQQDARQRRLIRAARNWLNGLS